MVCEYPDNPLKASRCFDEISYLLEKKYGKPDEESSESSESPDPEIPSINITSHEEMMAWDLEAKEIELTYRSCFGCGAKDQYISGSVKITYTPKRKIFSVESDNYQSEKNKI